METVIKVNVSSTAFALHLLQLSMETRVILLSAAKASIPHADPIPVDKKGHRIAVGCKNTVSLEILGPHLTLFKLPELQAQTTETFKSLIYIQEKTSSRAANVRRPQFMSTAVIKPQHGQN